MNKNKSLLNIKSILIIATSIFIHPTYANNVELSADTLLQNIANTNSANIAHSLINDPSKWNLVLKKIATGNQKWLLVANQLKPLTSAANAEALNFSVAEALIKNPRDAIAIIGKNFLVNEICVSPYIEGNPETEIKFLKRAIESVASVQDNNLRNIRNDCLKNLNLYLKANKNAMNENI